MFCWEAVFVKIENTQNTNIGFAVQYSHWTSLLPCTHIYMYSMYSQSTYYLSGTHFYCWWFCCSWQAFEDFINTDSRCASYLATYIDDLLKSGLRGMAEDEVIFAVVLSSSSPTAGHAWQGCCRYGSIVFLSVVVAAAFLFVCEWNPGLWWTSVLVGRFHATPWKTVGVVAATESQASLYVNVGLEARHVCQKSCWSLGVSPQHKVVGRVRNQSFSTVGKNCWLACVRVMYTSLFFGGGWGISPLRTSSKIVG